MPVGSSRVFDIPEYAQFHIPSDNIQQQIPNYSIQQNIQSAANNKPAAKDWDSFPQQPIQMNRFQQSDKEPVAFEQNFSSGSFGPKKQVINQQYPIQMKEPQANEDENKSFQEDFNK